VCVSVRLGEKEGGGSEERLCRAVMVVNACVFHVLRMKRG